MIVLLKQLKDVLLKYDVDSDTIETNFDVIVNSHVKIADFSSDFSFNDVK